MNAPTPAAPNWKVYPFPRRADTDDAARANGPLPPEVYAHLKVVMECGDSPRDCWAWELIRAHLDLCDADADETRP